MQLIILITDGNFSKILFILFISFDGDKFIFNITSSFSFYLMIYLLPWLVKVDAVVIPIAGNKFFPNLIR